jgi:hypothetical protein
MSLGLLLGLGCFSQTLDYTQYQFDRILGVPGVNFYSPATHVTTSGTASNTNIALDGIGFVYDAILNGGAVSTPNVVYTSGNAVLADSNLTNAGLIASAATFP